MPQLDCCRFRQASSNDLPNSKSADLPEEHPQPLPLNGTPTLSTSSDNSQPIRDIFASSNRETDRSEDQGFQHLDFGPKRAMLFGIRHKESSGRLHDIARILRKRVSRESDISKRSSKKQTESNLTEEDVERRRELKRALHRRLEEELLQDRTTSDDGYDSDAVPIKTPAGTWGRNGGSIRNDSDQIIRAVGRFDTSLQLLGRGLSHRNYPPRHDVDNSAHPGQASPSLYPSRSANFADPVPWDHPATASRRRSIHNIFRKPDSLHVAINVPGYKSGHEDQSRALEMMSTVGPDDSYGMAVNPAETRNAAPQISRSSSLNGEVHDMQGSPSATPKLRGPSGSLASLNSHAENQPNLKGYQNSRSGSTHLKVPKAPAHGQRVASSNYSSYNDSLESSRRSSLLKIQSLSERLACLKSSANNDYIYEAWSSAFDVSRVSCSQFTLSEIDETRRRTSDPGRLHPGPSSITAPESGIDKSWDLSPQRDVEKIKTRSFHEDLIVKPNREIRQKRIFSIEPQDSEHLSIANLDEGNDLYTSGRLQGYGCYPTAPANEDRSSFWENALRNNADVNYSFSQTVPLKEHPALHKSMVRGTVGSGKRKFRPGLRRGVEYKSSDIWKGHSNGADLKLPISMDTNGPENRLVLEDYKATMPPSWCRYPSHTRAERALSPAGAADNVFPRDFAVEFRKAEATDEQKRKVKVFRKQKLKSKSMTFGRSMIRAMGRIYNIDLRRYHGGHRSSISVGGKLEYPELEILPQLSPILHPLNEPSKSEMVQVLNALPVSSNQQNIAQRPFRDDETNNGAKNWSKLYEDCVHYPVDADESWIEESTSRILLRSRAVSDSTRLRARKVEFSSQSSAEMRSSTLDFQKALQDHEAKAKKRALQAADNLGAGRLLAPP